MNKTNVLLIDVETTPNEGYCWGKYEQTIIKYKREKDLLCFAYKWQGDKDITFVGRDRHKSDKPLVQELVKLLNKADLVIAQNGDRFDVRFINTRILFWKTKPPRPYATRDTCKLARKYFLFNSNKLNDIAEYLGFGKKNRMVFDDWLACMSGDATAWEKMKQYNKQDVHLLEETWSRFKLWDLAMPNLSLLRGERRCPNCSSHHVVRKGFTATTHGRKQQYQCHDCGKWTTRATGERLPGYKECK